MDYDFAHKANMKIKYKAKTKVKQNLFLKEKESNDIGHFNICIFRFYLHFIMRKQLRKYYILIYDINVLFVFPSR